MTLLFVAVADVVVVVVGVVSCWRLWPKVESFHKNQFTELHFHVKSIELRRASTVIVKRDRERQQERGSGGGVVGASEKELEQYLPVTVSAAGPLPVPIVYPTNKANWS